MDTTSLNGVPKEEEERPKRSCAAKRKRKSITTYSDEQIPDTEDDPMFEDMPEDDNGMFEKYKKDKQWKLEKIPHHFLPSFNITNSTNINEVRELPLLRISLPHSVYVGSKLINDVDVCHRRTMALAAYMTRLRTMRKAYITAKKKSKQVRKDEKNGIYSGTLIDLAKRLDINPDKYFSSDYDFYYTGGNLCVNPETQKILHVSGKNMENLVLSVFNVEDGNPAVHQLTATEDENDASEIFEVQFSKSERNSFFVRRKFCISMHQEKGNQIHVVANFKSKKVPFISFAQDKVNTNHLAISNLQHQVRLFDLENGHSLKTYQLGAKENLKPTSNWNMIRSWDSHVYIYAASRRLDIIDTRVPESEWRNNYCGYEEDSYCSNFCSFSLSNFDNLFYIGSNHKVYCIDKRYMIKNIEGKNGAVSRWTHQMSCCPLMLATNRHENCEYITLQSPLSADLRICENIQYLAESNIEIGVEKRPRTELPPEYNYKSPCLPYMPPSLENLLQEARLHGKCIQPVTGIVNRIKACNTGLSFVGDSSKPCILTATSNGDIFARHLYHPDDDCKADQASAADVMSLFENNIFRSVRKPPLQITEVCDLSGISKVFRCPILSDVKPPHEFLAIPSKRKYMGRWQKSVQSLYKYKDALASDLLSIWDIEVEEEKDFNITALSQNIVADSTSLVSGWLDAAQSTMVNMTTIPMDVLNQSSAVLGTSLEETFMFTSTQVELEETTTSPPVKSKVSKKKSNYIKGF